MAKTISQLTDATVVNGSDELIIQQSGVTKRATRTELMSGSISSEKFVPTGTSATGNGMYLPATNAVAISTDGNERMRIDSSGNVGIGTGSPGAKCDLRNGTLRLSTDNSRTTVYGINRGDTESTNGMCSIGMFGSGSNGFLGNIAFNTAASDVFNAALSERMRIDANGNVGIGTNTPSSKLHVAGDLTVSSATTATAATAGANGDVPAQVEGYLVVSINGTSRKIPYYAT